MKRCTLLLSLMALTAAGCDGDSAGCDLDPKPQLNPNAEAGVIGFELSRLQEFNTLDAVFINGGCQRLQIDLASIDLIGPDAAEFETGQIFPEDGGAGPRGAIGIPVTFTSPGRGVYQSTLVFDSNAENFPNYELDLIAPAADARIPDEADIEFIEDPVEVGPSAALGFDANDKPIEAALVRFYNLGGRSLSVSRYHLQDTTNFRFFSGTAQPSADCTYGAICRAGDGPEQGCCEGGLSCRCLDFQLDGQTCSRIVAQEYAGAAPLCPGGQSECDAFGLVCAGGTCVDACTTDEQCAAGELCENGACGAPAQVCASVNVTSGQFNILAVQLTDEAPAGAHSTTLEITTNDPDTPVASVTINGTK